MMRALLERAILLRCRLRRHLAVVREMNRAWVEWQMGDANSVQRGQWYAKIAADLAISQLEMWERTWR